MALFGGGGKRTLTVEVAGDESGAVKAMQKVEGAAGKMGHAVAKAGKAIGLLGVAAGAAAGVGVYKAINAASDLSEAQNKANEVFGDSVDIMNEFAKTSANAFGISKAEALDAAGGMGAMFGAMGLTKDAAANMSVEMTKLAADMASFNNEEPTAMLERLRAGLTGEAEPLKRFGVLINEASVQTEALNMGLIKEGETLTEQQKVLARYSLILKQTETQQGDFARTSDGMANMQRRLRAVLADLTATLGQDLLPVAERVLRFLLEKLLAFQTWVENNREQIRAFFYAVVDALETMKNYFLVGFDTIQPLLERFGKFLIDNKPAMIAAIVALGVAIAFALGPVSAAAIAITAMITAIGYLRENWERVAIGILKVVDWMINGMISGINAVLGAIEDMINALVNKLPGWAKDLFGIGSGPAVSLKIGEFTGFDATIAKLEEQIRKNEYDAALKHAQEFYAQSDAAKAAEAAARKAAKTGGEGFDLLAAAADIAASTPVAKAAAGGAAAAAAAAAGSTISTSEVAGALAFLWKTGLVAPGSVDIRRLSEGDILTGGLPTTPEGGLVTKVGDLYVTVSDPLGSPEEIAQKILQVLTDLEDAGQINAVTTEA